jgi:2-polyprenyl-3-methyl-5-hydroxy-6-metoxy-1,4-benzoquinol methylase
MNELPEHLGGHNNVTHIDRGAFLYLQDKFAFYSMLDIGCGLGGMIQYAMDRGVSARGVDGDFTLTYPDDIRKFITLHDFTKGPLPESKILYDLGWSVEFLEHVDEEYQDNYMKAFQLCNYVVATAAPPGYPGHHHVNCRDQEYWIDVFAKYGFKFLETETKEVRAYSTMRKPFMNRTGMVFEKEKVV